MNTSKTQPGDAFSKAYALVSQLSDDFHGQRNYYISQGYQESEVRKDFIDKFLVALGWDVNHESQKNPYAQEVKVERSVTTGGSQRRADYAFYLAPNYLDVQFYVEAKKPSSDLVTPDNCFQVIRYGWNSDTPIAVLTDFEKLQIMDCRYKPNIKVAEEQTLASYTYIDYKKSDLFAEIYYLFSREAVSQGSLRKYAKTLPRRKGGAVQRGLFPGGYKAIDESFLEELAEYRRVLAGQFKKADESLDGEALTEITQRALDRLVFLRFLEDKGIEPEYRVASYGDSSNAWKDFISDCRSLDSVYNGIVFKQHSVLDSDHFQIEDDAFSDICKKLSHQNSPYDFNSIPIHVLGSIYERFLGSVIVAGAHTARVEEKPEVRHAGGVYYTPEFVVRSIVANTIGRLIDGKTPDQVAKMRFADIACGSGSFLLSVFDTLLRYHSAYYNEHPDTAKPVARTRGPQAVYERDGALHLTLSKKRQILRDNVFGVDIDAQAVEVAQLSLYLRLLEDETISSTQPGQIEIREAVLPSLARNIVCGNSLVETDILSRQILGRDREHRINAMDIGDRFPSVLKEGGFHAIVGNPPYIRVQVLQQTQPETCEYLQANYASAASGNFDIYVAFVERALRLVRDAGLVGYIVPHKFMNANYGEGLRGLIAQEGYLRKVVHFGHQQIFDGVSTYTCLLFLQKSPITKAEIILVDDIERWVAGAVSRHFSIPAKTLGAGPWIFRDGDDESILKKIRSISVDLSAVTDRIFQGLKTGADKVFIVNAVSEGGKQSVVRCALDGLEYEIESALLHRLVKGGDAYPFAFGATERRIIFPYITEDDATSLLPPQKLREAYPLTWAYLKKHRSELDSREDGRFAGSSWYQYSRSQALDVIQRPKIFSPDLALKPSFAIDARGDAFFTGGVAGGYGIVPRSDVDPRYLAGILNSRVSAWIVASSATVMRGGYFSFEARFIRSLPIPLTKDRDDSHGALRDRLIELVDAISQSTAASLTVRTDRDKDYLLAKLATLHRQLDEVVFSIFNLSPEEQSTIIRATDRSRVAS